MAKKKPKKDTRNNFVQVILDKREAGKREVPFLLIAEEGERHGRLLDRFLHAHGQGQHPKFRDRYDNLPSLSGPDYTVVGLGKGEYISSSNTLSDVSETNLDDDYNSTGYEIGYSEEFFKRFSDLTLMKVEYRKRWL